jgi:hypothetical protein
VRRLLSALAAVAMIGAVSALGAVAPVVDAQADPRNGIPPDQAPSTLQDAPLDAAVSGLGSSSLVAGAVPARPAQADVLTQAQPQAKGPSLLRLDVTQLTPRVIRAGTADQERKSVV